MTGAVGAPGVHPGPPQDFLNHSIRRCPVPELPSALAEALRDRYVLERELGRGGMATVYAALDVRHDRRVALKVLHPELAESLGPDRFQREIRFAAQLQHPHILPVHDSGEAAGRLFYVMPLVQGESLRQRLARDGELPVAEAVRLLEEIVEALAYAHAQGVVHRDIKPDNIMLSGRHALLTDLGVAKAVSAAVGTTGEALTVTGIAIGTPRYMAPEQAAADPHVDHRADIYAVGVTAYEMLAGTAPFTGGSAQAVFAAQVAGTPTPLATLRPGISPLLSELVARCLAPRPADRWQSAADLLAQLERLHDSGEVTTPVRTVATAPSEAMPAARRWLVPVAIASVVVVVAVAVAALLITRRPASEIRFGTRAPLTVEPGLEIDPAVSPDGQLVAYAAGTLNDSKIYVRQADGGRPIAPAADLPGAERLPYWSPDSKRILFRSVRGIETVPALGGTPRVLVPRSGQEALFPGPWSPDGREVAFARSDSLFVLPADGGVPTLLTVAGEMHSFAWSPDGRWIALVRGNRQSVDPDVPWFVGNLGQSGVWLVPATAGAGAPVQVTDDHSFHASPVWLPDSRGLLVLSDADGGLDVYRVALSSSGTPARPVRLTTGLNAHAMSADAAGRRVVYEVYEEHSNVWSLPIPTDGPIGLAGALPVTTGNQVVESSDVSPDGRWLVFDSDRSGVSQIYRMPLAGGQPEQLTTDSSAKFWPVWSPDGREISYHAFREGGRQLYVMSADGSGRELLRAAVNDRPGWGSGVAEWDRQGRGLYYDYDFDGPGAEIRFLPRDGAGHWGKPRTVLRIRSLITMQSPNGRTLAFASEKGLMLTTSTGDSGRVLVPGSFLSRELRPAYESWSADGRTLYYLALDSVDHASIWSIHPPAVDPKLLVRFDDPTREWHRYGFTSFGGRFYFTLGDRQSDLWTVSVERGP